MKPIKNEQYVAFLRGINVGGHHKVPMSELKKEFQSLDFENIVTLLNSGNIIFDTLCEDITKIEKKISVHLEKSFGFTIPTIIRKSEAIYELLSSKPFKDVKITKDIRLYVSFLRKSNETELILPWKSSDSSFEIIDKNNNTLLSVLDLSLSKSVKAMAALEKQFGKDITTRNWNTIERIGKQLNKS